MAFDPTYPEDMARLRRCIRESRQTLKKFYEAREVILNALHDPCHTSDVIAAEDRIPHNPLDRMVRIVTRSVVSQNPTQRIVRTKRPRVSGMLKTQLDRWARRADLADTLQHMFVEGIIRWGIVFTGFDTHDQGYGMDPWAEPVDFDDYFIDLRGNDENKIDFEGHRYAKRLSELQNNPVYDQNVVDRLSESRKNRYAHGTSTTLYEWVDLACAWLPQEQMELTIVDEGGTGVGMTVHEPLRIKPYQGPPDTSPYVRLSLSNVPGTMVPVSRAGMLFDLHDFVVRAYRQLYVQADDFLEFYGYSGESEKDAEKHRTAFHGEYVRFDNPGSVDKYTKGGVNPQVMGAAIHADELFNSDAGNLNLLGGLGPSAPTARQESGLGAGVQGMVDDARQRMDKATKQIMDIAAWYIMHDPYRREEVDWTTPEGLTQSSMWNPEDMNRMEMNKQDEEWEIIPGSMISRSAEQQLASLVQAVDNVARTLALPGEDPTVFKHRRYRERMAEYGNLPELAEFFGEAPDQESVVPGSETAAQFAAPGRTGRPQGPAPAGQSKMVDRMVFSGAGAQNGAPPA